LLKQPDKQKLASLWWVRIRGRATVHHPATPGLGVLKAKYEQYCEKPPGGHRLPHRDGRGALVEVEQRVSVNDA
jgi:hypothetical protein